MTLLPALTVLLTALAAPPTVADLERHFAEFLDAHGARETIDSGLVREIEGRNRDTWHRLREKEGRIVADGLKALEDQKLGPEDTRLVHSMRVTFDELAGSGSMAPSRKCAAGASRDLDVAALKEALYACFDEVGNHIRFENREVTRSGALQMLQEIQDPERRKALFMAMEPLWRSVNGNGTPARSPYRRLISLVASDPGGTETSPAGVARVLGVEAADMERWLVEVLEAWRRANPPGKTLIEPWDFRHHYARASHRVNAAIPRKSLEDLNTRFARDLGADARELGIRYDLAPRPGKAPIAYADAMRIGRMKDGAWRPAIARVSANYDRGGLYTINELVHETGHAVHIAAVRARPAFFWPDTLFMEAFADVPSWSVFDPTWQQKYLGKAAPRADALREQFALVMLDVAWGLFEIRMLREPAADPNAVWTQLTQTYLGIAPHPDMAWWAVRAQLVGNPGYMLNYAAGAILTADLRARTRAAIGPFDAGNPRWYPWLSENLLKHGASIDAPEMLRQFLGRPVSPQALIAEIGSIVTSSEAASPGRAEK
jgi:hypothetical protein